MSKYKIEIYYSTGDSFHTEDRQDLLDGTWKDLEIAKENLSRIKEHYLWYSSIHNYPYKQNVKKPEWHKGKEYSITLKTDDNKDYSYGAFWCGYFETLYDASIVNEKEDLPRISI
jgi:hypothetical protein